MARLSFSASKKKEGGRDKRRASLSSPLKSLVGSAKRMDWVKNRLQRAADAMDKATKDLFVDDQEDACDLLFIERGQGQLKEFQGRYKHLLELLGDLGLADDVDPYSAANLLAGSEAQRDLDTMLALLRAEEIQNSRAEHVRVAGGTTAGGADGGSPIADDKFSTDLLAAPCLEFLLEERVVKVLCEVGATDRPTGTMALVLGACASLLGQVGHPLLPSRAIHEPLSELMAAASSYRCMGVHGGAIGDQQRRLAAQRREEARVQSNLAALLGAIWRKLREENALLAYFLRPNRQPKLSQGEKPPSPTSEYASSSVCPEAVRIEIFDSLLPLLELTGRPGQRAREACLVALSVKNRRVGAYAASETEFCEQVSTTLTARYLALYDSLEELYAAATEASSRDATIADRTLLAEEAFADALAYFLQHLRFCNAAGLVASDVFRVQACTVMAANSQTDAPKRRTGECQEDLGEDQVGPLLATCTRHSLLDEALGPAISSALESRVIVAQAIAARIVAELANGVEGYGVAAAGMSACGGEDGCRRQLGPLLENVSSFLVGRKDSMIRGEGPTDFNCQHKGRPGHQDGSADDGAGHEAGRQGVRSILVQRMESAPSSLRVSVLELIACLAELRDDNVFLDLVLRPNAVQCRRNGAQQAKESLEGYLEVSDDSVQGLKVSRTMVESFGSAFSGSPIHPHFRRFTSKISLEGYLVEAHQRQIQQLMEARSNSAVPDEDESDTDDRTACEHAQTPAQDIEEDKSVSAKEGERGCLNRMASEGAPEREFDSECAAFVEKFGPMLAEEADMAGAFIHVLFNLLEGMFDRSLEENVALTGVLSSLCLAATAAEVSPVRRLLLVLLFDGTADATFRSMRRILQQLWSSAQGRISSMPDAPRLLAKARAKLGMGASDFVGPEEVEIAGIGPSRLRASMTHRSGDQHTPAAIGDRSSAEVRMEGGKGCLDSQFLETYVFLEEFLKELFCVLHAKSHVQTDTHGLSVLHRIGTEEARRGLDLLNDCSCDDADLERSPSMTIARVQEAVGGEATTVEDEMKDLPTSLDQFLREAEFPKLVSQSEF